MAKRFIDAEKLNYLMCSIYWGEDEEGNEVYRQTEVAFRTDIEQIPTADVVEVRHGEWIWTENGEADYEQYWVCSVCGEKSYIETKYCSDCGAKMDGGVTE